VLSAEACTIARVVVLEFAGGMLRLRDLDASAAALFAEELSWDPREAVFRAPAHRYAPIVRGLIAKKIAFRDDARAYVEMPLSPRSLRTPYPHQSDAIAAWLRAQGRGLVVLPTGAGKSLVAMMAIAEKKRSALIVVPTLDLMAQWHHGLCATFDTKVGLVGGGSHEVLPITVTTYDSAYLHMDRLGNRFGLVIFDEVHHLPSDAYATAARMCIAPFRLGLTATPERQDGRETIYDELVGETVFRKDITDLAGHYLAPYETVRVRVPMSTDERAAYDEARATYIAFIRKHRIDFSSPNGFGQFLLRSNATREGREAFDAYRRQRSLALAAPKKLDVLSSLLVTHRQERIIIFTDDNATVYAISRRLLIPAITHQTRVAERAAILKGMNDGSIFAVVTSRVLNEGVDVPSASVAIVLSGSGSVREHVQRLGRVLRKSNDKRATLYELVSESTSEERTSDKRREHIAYR
jgi:superfamily II DNA or RNA helicase